MVKIHKLDKYLIEKEDKFFFDANIWMYLYCSIGDYDEELINSFSEFFQKIRTSGSPIFTTSLLISEFVNTYSRLEFQIARKRDSLKNYKKDFRSSLKYKDVFDNINLLTEKKIIGNTVPINDSFDDFDVENFYKNKNTYDFNDEYYCYLAYKYKFKIVTNDKDFTNSNYDIEIITI